jgi:hypothetical protein
MPTKEQDHGPDTVCYSMGDPYILCLCGWHTAVNGCRTWEEAGAEFDEHLSETENA